MKDYIKKFENDNTSIFEQISNLNSITDNNTKRLRKITIGIVIFGILIVEYLVFDLKFLGFRWEWLVNLNSGNSFYQGVSFVVGGIIAVLGPLMGFFWTVEPAINKPVKKERQELINILAEKAKEFTTGVYLDDIIAALSSTFTVSSEFKEKLRKVILNNPWLSQKTDDDDNITCSFNPDGILLDYMSDENDRLILKKESTIYYLTEWDHYTNLPFRFTFARIDPNGMVTKDIEFELPLTK